MVSLLRSVLLALRVYLTISSLLPSRCLVSLNLPPLLPILEGLCGRHGSCRSRYVCSVTCLIILFFGTRISFFALGKTVSAIGVSWHPVVVGGIFRLPNLVLGWYFFVLWILGGLNFSIWVYSRHRLSTGFEFCYHSQLGDLRHVHVTDSYLAG